MALLAISRRELTESASRILVLIRSSESVRQALENDGVIRRKRNHLAVKRGGTAQIAAARRDVGLLEETLFVDRHASDPAALLDSRGLTREPAQEVQLGAANAPVPYDLDLGDHRRVNRENTLDPDTAADFAHPE